MNMTPNKPYLIRAIYDWIVDNNLTPYILVNADYPGVQVPVAHVNNGRIVLNISPQACRGLHLENDRIVFTARFSGQTVQIFVVPAAVIAIYAKENGRGMEFGVETSEPPPPPPVGKIERRGKNKPALTLVKKTDS
ncbi:ClpXP protease specificity-enhancing factor [Legionella sp. MW5194]|uniref:ClpXP protease specificity-enhancing factor n=1 Tax=Legionella sp. MW5194 TaxID=2662448 RepID=UPI00193DAA70|nr:ClpXP protease specificity-enhancing factor [Legionella sp. MW5194]QRN05048.1 ClpXP protease specificity-enhancing factor [Legionella sp. MW5194]